MSLSTSRVLVTGGNGFIGHALLSCLHDLGLPAIGSSRSVHNLDNVVVAPSLSSFADWRPLLHKCNIVVHTAARVHCMQDLVADPLALYREVNVKGTMRLAEQAVEAGVRRFVFISSIKVNGEMTMYGQPFMADDVPVPVDIYAVSKAEAEVGLLHLAAQTGLEVVVIRPPLVYGPGVGANFLKMMKWLKRGVPLPLGAVSQNCRTLVGLGNLMDLIITCMEHPAAANQVFLAGDGVSVSTAELLRRLASAMGVPARLIPVPVWVIELGAGLLGKHLLAQRLCGNLQVDISKAHRLLGWVPQISMDDELKRTAVWYGQQAK